MPFYHITWEINLDADTPLEAAKTCLEMQRDPNGTATWFTVRQNGDTAGVDIDAADTHVHDEGSCCECGSPDHCCCECPKFM